MFLDFGLVWNAVLLVLGILWCREVFGRFATDLEEFRQSQDSAERGAIALWWVVTVLIVLLMANFVIANLRNILG